MTDVCPQCGGEYQRVATHWYGKSCDRPAFNQRQLEIVTGLLMGDGCLARDTKGNPRMVVVMTSQNYLKYLDKQFGIFGNGVVLSKTGKENAKKTRNSGFRPNAVGENYSDLYRWASMKHPQLKEFEHWYSSGKKIWPTDIKLTPTVLKHWYCGDGSYDNNGTHNRIQIAMSNEANNLEKVDRMFKNVNLPSPSNYNIANRKSRESIKCNAEFTVKQSEKLWKYMGEPLPDFEYKWPEQYRNTYAYCGRNMGTK